MHGYDIAKDVPGGRLGALQLPGRARGRLRGRARGPQGTDRRAEGLALMRAQVGRRDRRGGGGDGARRARTAAAHGLVGRADLPIPAWLFGWAAAVVLIVSFVGLATLWQTPKLEGDERFRPLPDGLSFALVNPATEVFAGLVGVGLLGVTIWAGLAGRAVAAGQLRPHLHLRDLLGRAGACSSILFGDVFRAFNPWRAIARARRLGRGARVRADAGAVPLPGAARPLAGGGRPARLRLDGACLPQRQRPEHARDRRARLQRDYAARHRLLRHRDLVSRGEAFSVYFNLFSRISPLDGEGRPARPAHARCRRRRSSIRSRARWRCWR